MLPRSVIYQALWNHLETVDRITEAFECLHEMEHQLGDVTQGKDSKVKWVPGERLCAQRSCATAESFPTSRVHQAKQGILGNGNILNDANKVWKFFMPTCIFIDGTSQAITIDPSYHLGTSESTWRCVRQNVTKGR